MKDIFGPTNEAKMLQEFFGSDTVVDNQPAADQTMEFVKVAGLATVISTLASAGMIGVILGASKFKTWMYNA